MSEYLRRTWAEVNISAVKENYRAISGLAGENCLVMAVVKADGYGHGAVRISQALSEAGAQWFGVSNIDEALQLRAAGITQPMLILGYTPPGEAARLAEYDITQTIFDTEYGNRLNSEAERRGVKLKVHIKLDTGMGRIGINCLSAGGKQEAVREVQRMCRLPAFECEGIYTHFASADEPDDGGYTRGQYSLFCEIVDELDINGFSFKLRHCCNSAATLHYPEMCMDMIRPGLALYGLYPDRQLAKKLALQPAMQLRTVVSMMKQAEANTCVSYNRTYKTRNNGTILATVPLGYADGYPRQLSGKSEMLVCGQRAPVVGRVCMDQCVLDVTGIDCVSEDTTVTVFGGDGNLFISADELATAADTVNYEIVCNIGKRVPRIYQEKRDDYICVR